MGASPLISSWLMNRKLHTSKLEKSNICSKLVYFLKTAVEYVWLVFLKPNY